MAPMLLEPDDVLRLGDAEEVDVEAEAVAGVVLELGTIVL